MSDEQTSNQHLSDINQEFKENDVQSKANQLGLSYINLLNFRANPDVLTLISFEESKEGNIVVFFQIGKKIRLALTDPNNVAAQEIIKKLKNDNFAVNINLASLESVQSVQGLYQTKLFKKEENTNIEIDEKSVVVTDALAEFKAEEQNDKTQDNRKSSEVLKDIHALAIKTHVSDIHFQPEKEQVLIRFRIDGMLQDITKLDHLTYQGVCNQIKMNSHLKLNISKQPQDGKYFFEVNERIVDVRVATMPTLYGESIVLRLLDSKRGVVALSDLGFKKYALEKIAKSLTKSEGMILVTGPTGSGKTTTLYSILSVLNKPHRKIITLEDPIEYQLKNITQCEVSRNEEHQVSFEDALVASLRSDPDVIMVGEIREPKVANIAFQASMTGHLVLSTLHTNSAIETFSRLRNLDVPIYLLNAALTAILAQRLLRRICKNCQITQDWEKNDLDYLTRTAESLKARGIEMPSLPKQKILGTGCKHCNNTGYSGRITVAEVLLLSEKIREAIQNQKYGNEILAQAVSEGFITMKEDGVIKVINGETTLEEVWKTFG